MKKSKGENPVSIAEDASRKDSEKTLKKHAEAGVVSGETVHETVGRLRTVTQKKMKTALMVEKQLSLEQQETLLGALKARFEKNSKLHEKIDWADVEKALRIYPEKPWSLQQLESTGGEPDVIGEENGEFVFGDCSTESPSGRRNVVFDKKAEVNLRGKNAHGGSNAIDMVAGYGAELMDVAKYRAIQTKIPLDVKTWSWLKTSDSIRKTGHAVISGRGRMSNCEVGFHNESNAFRAVLRVPKK